MAQNRYLPYGYKIVNGKIETDIYECEVIRLIYTQYANGWSYKKIAEKLTADKKPYIEGKPTWNKNMVARILQNSNYLGTDKYPSVVDEITFKKAQKSMKPYTRTVSNDIKNLKPLLVCECGKQLKRRTKQDYNERWYCPNDIAHISTSLTDDIIIGQVTELQKLVANGESPITASGETSLEIIKLQNEIDRLLEQSEIDTAQIREMVLNLATEKYSALNSQPNYIDPNLLKQLSQSKELNVEQLKSVTSEIRIKDNKVVALILKNNIVIETGVKKND